MTIQGTDADCKVIPGDCMAVLPTLPAGHFHVCMTSPPYFALRSYLAKDHPLKPQEIGSEPTPDAFIETMVAVFRSVRRVMHPTGLLFLNLGDSYNQYNAGQTAEPGTPSGNTQHARPVLPKGHGLGDKNIGSGQLLNIPHRVAEALRADGWVWRQTIIWQKPSPMPESCKGWRWERCKVKVKAQSGNMGGMAYKDVIERDGGWTKDTHPGTRKPTEYTPCPGCPKCIPHGGLVLRRGKGRCTTAHEYIFVMAVSDRYFWDSAAFVEEAEYANSGRESKARGEFDGKGSPMPGREPFRAITPTRNPRSVWTISAEPTSLKHFAAYPSELVRRCVQAGTSDGGCCPECGMPWAPMVEMRRGDTEAASRPKRTAGMDSKTSTLSLSGNGSREWAERGSHSTILGYRPTCECSKELARAVWGDGERVMTGQGILTLAGKVAEQHLPVPCRVLDPFAGTGRTLATAKWMGRDSVGIELNPDYVEFCRQTITEPPRWWLQEHEPPPPEIEGQLSLFEDLP
ncbi:MAG TPA: DNA methyltransferase [Phycisphaerae bacterium]|nr:DNA methyltransferase [Phycisphaerae bacterium]